VAVQERIQTLSKRFPNIIGSHTVSNTTRKGLPALQEALEVEGTYLTYFRSTSSAPALTRASLACARKVVAYGHSVSDWFKHMPVAVLALHDKLRQIRKFGYPPEGEGDDAARNKNDTIVRKKNKPVPVISFSDLAKVCTMRRVPCAVCVVRLVWRDADTRGGGGWAVQLALGYGMNHHQLQSCLRFWTDVGIISYINDPHQRGWYHRGESTSLSSWVFLDRNWLAHLYLRLCQNAREFTPKVFGPNPHTQHTTHAHTRHTHTARIYSQFGVARGACWCARSEAWPCARTSPLCGPRPCARRSGARLRSCTSKRWRWYHF
jgi:hypothetical protein